MYLEYWGLERFPFDNAPDPNFFYVSNTHEEGLNRLLYAAELGKGCALLAGDVGVGKTTLSHVFLQKLSAGKFEIVLISNPCQDRNEFLQDILYKLGADTIPSRKVEILQVLQEKLEENADRGRKTLLIVDEAQLLSEEMLEEVRLLLNFQSSHGFLITIILMGQLELIEKVKKIQQLQQRIAIKYFLKPFNLSETLDYILYRQKKAGAHRNVFDKDAIRLIYRHSHGLPRMINHLCDLMLLVGAVKKKKRIDEGIVKELLNDESLFGWDEPKIIARAKNAA
jgi:general secretion pathway protein A